MRAVYPLVPLAANTALGIAVLSYDGRLNFGLNADYDALPDLELLARDLEQAIAEIVQRVGRREALIGLLRKVADRERDAREAHSRRLIVAHLDLPHPGGAAGVLAGRVRFDVPPVTGRRKLVRLDMPLAHLALRSTTEAVENEVRPSAMAA